MLIRSQDKRILINMNNVSRLEMSGDGLRIFADNGRTIFYGIGEYSTKAKAMKVLDMIQEAYSDFESAKITSTGLATAAYAISLNYDTPENVFDGINALKEYGDSIKELMVFQMPADSEVEV